MATLVSLWAERERETERERQKRRLRYGTLRYVAVRYGHPARPTGRIIRRWRDRRAAREHDLYLACQCQRDFFSISGIAHRSRDTGRNTAAAERGHHFANERVTGRRTGARADEWRMYVCS
jgi:hypothetical protein